MQTVVQNLKNSAQIEILVPRNTVTNQLTFPFPDQPFLRGKQITAIALSVNTYSAQSGLLNVNAYIPLNGTLTVIGTNSIFITLQDINGTQFIQNMPLLELNPYNFNDNSGADLGVSKHNADGIIAFQPKEVVWTKSYISVPTPAFTVASAFDRGFQFSVFFN
jgi:hypothetical protein